MFPKVNGADNAKAQAQAITKTAVNAFIDRVTSIVYQYKNAVVAIASVAITNHLLIKPTIF
jgi:hypothetical protein